MKNFYSILFFGMLLIGSHNIVAQNAPPEFTPAPTQSAMSLLAAFKVNNIALPDANTTDFIAAVDSDDANVILGVGRAAGQNGELFATVDVNPPVGVNNSFHLIYYDVSEDLFHVLLDTLDNPIDAPFLPNTEGSFVEGFEIGNMGLIAGRGIIMPDGEMDLNEIISQLPVELSSFTARYEGKLVGLNWVTETESGNERFEVQRSAYGLEFVTIGKVAGRGDSRESVVYHYTDETPLVSSGYYRLKQVDYDGTYSLSSVLLIQDRRATMAGFNVFPNPARDRITISVQGEWKADNVEATLTDISGRIVKRWIQSTQNAQTIDLPVNGAGLFQLRLENKEQVVVKRLSISGK